MKIDRLALVAVLLTGVGQASADIVLSTLMSNPVNAFVGAGPSREPNSTGEFYSGGQTFVASAGATTLSRFSLVVQHQDFIPPGSPWGAEVPALVRGAVMMFSGNTAVGDSPLFLSDIVTVPINGFAPQLLTFETGNLPVTAGTQYGVFITRIGVGQTGLYRLHLPMSNLSVTATPPTYASGSWSAAPSFAAASGATWSHHVLSGALDAQFEARFNDVPEPHAAWMMMVLGISLRTRMGRH